MDNKENQGNLCVQLYHVIFLNTCALWVSLEFINREKLSIASAWF